MNRTPVRVSLHAILLPAFLFLFALPAAAQGAGAMQARGCDANKRTIEGAVELFIMERSAAEAGSVTVEALTSDGYLRTAPVCPAGGAYRIVMGQEGGVPVPAVLCSVHDGETEDGPVDAPAATEPAAVPARGDGEVDPVAILQGARPVYSTPEGAAKGCLANLRTLVGAAELQAIVHPPTVAETTTPAALKAGGYLLSDIDCPAGGEYTIEISPAGVKAACSVHGTGAAE